MRVLAAVAVLVGACGQADPPPPAAAPVTVPAAPGQAPTARIVSLSPSATEIVAALGATPQLVGVDSFSKFPPEVAGVAKVGDYLHPSLEVIIQLRPTLVIADDVHTATTAALRDAHIDALVCAIHTLADVEACLTAAGAKLGHADEATRVIASMEATVAAARARAHDATAHPRVLLVLDRDADELGNIVAAGPGSYVDELLAITGGANVLASSPLPYPKVSLDTLLGTRPDVVFDMSFPAHTSLAVWDGVGIPAVANHRVVALTDDTLMAPSPRVGQALAAIEAALHK